MERFVFIHPSGFTGEIFEKQLAYFPGSAAPNLPGHDAAGSASSVAEFADFIEQYLQAEQRDEVILCGNSLGGAVALEVALRGNAHVQAVALIGSGARLRVAPRIFERLDADFPGAVRELAPMFYANPTTERTERAVSQMERVGKLQTLADFRACDAFDAMERLPGLRVPLLAITGDADVFTPPKYAAYLADRVPRGELRIVPRAGHLVMDEASDDTNKALADFVTKLA